MSVFVLCNRCSPGGALARLGLPATSTSEVRHCYGTGDEPGTPGLIGSGVYCPCECRTWPHQPHELYAVAAKEHPGDPIARRDRYIALMTEHGHIIGRPTDEGSPDGP